MSAIYYFAKLFIAIELRRSHGVYFASAFLEDYESEIRRAIDERSKALVSGSP